MVIYDNQLILFVLILCILSYLLLRTFLRCDSPRGNSIASSGDRVLPIRRRSCQYD